jgi:TolB-like protein/Tfp pilus assembly protein PilF
LSYLRVISRASTQGYADRVVDGRAVGEEIGARYVMQGSIRQAGSTLRIAAQLVDAVSGANLWAESYKRPFDPEEIFEQQDDVAPRIVSTVADMNGVLPHSMSELLRHCDSQELSPYEAVLRGFGYLERIEAEEHAEVRAALERAVDEAPDQADAWAMLSMMYAEEHKHGFNAKPKPLDRALEAARRAVATAPADHLGYHMLAQALFFRRELQEFRNAAERAVALNPMDGCTTAFMGILMAYAGDWDHGCALAERAMELNPHHPGWYRFSAYMNAYRQQDFRAALDVALKFNMPSYFYTHAAIAAARGQLGEHEAAQRAVKELLALKPDFAASAREEFAKWVGQGELLESFLDGLRKAGLDIPAAGQSPASPVGAESPATPSIAVLPFINMSADKENQYFSEGLAEEIINALTRLPDLRVIARTSAFRFRDEQDLRKVGEALGVRTLLEGSVRRSGARLRITAQLTDVEDQSHLWSERFDRELDDVFAIQDEISAAIVEKLHLSLGVGGPATRDRTNLAAFEALLEGRHYFNQFTPSSAERAIACLQQALSIEPDYPDALVLQSFYHVMLAYMFADPREELPQAKALAERALKLEPHHGEAQAVVALVVVWMDRDWAGGERLFHHALELAPGSARVHELYGLIALLGRGQLAEALAELDRTVELDPLSALYAGNRGRVLTCSRRFAEAEESCRRGLALDPGQLLVQIELVYALTFQRKFAEAEAIGRSAIETHGYGKAPLHALAVSLALAGKCDEVPQLLVDAAEVGSGDYRSSLTFGLVHAAGSEMDDAFECVQRAIDERDPLLMYLQVHPMFDALRADSRYPELLRRMNLLEGS